MVWEIVVACGTAETVAGLGGVLERNRREVWNLMFGLAKRVALVSVDARRDVMM